LDYADICFRLSAGRFDGGQPRLPDPQLLDELRRVIVATQRYG